MGIHFTVGRFYRVYPMRKCIASVLLFLPLLLCVAQIPVEAATIYRWTDDQGKTHYAESVPEKYQKSAQPLSPANSSPTQEQQREARERAARENNRASEIEAAASKTRPASKPAPSTQAPKRPAQVPDEKTDCETWTRLFRESLDCFGPYRTTRGATREEAFTYCTPVDELPSRCR